MERKAWEATGPRQFSASVCKLKLNSSRRKDERSYLGGWSLDAAGMGREEVRNESKVP